MTSAIIVAVIVIAAIGIYYHIRKQKIIKSVKNKEEYKVPLSDDVQRIYYDNYEKKLKEEQEAAQSASKDEAASSQSNASASEEQTASK